MSEQRSIDANALIEKYGDWYTEEGTEQGYIGTIEGIVDAMPTIEERKTGEWTEKEVIYKDEASKVIEEWQSARCSNCGLYHTTPYSYYFDSFNYCPHCGADMRGEQE